MTITMFLALLFAFSTLSSLVTEAVKKFINDKENISYNIIALIAALIVGGFGTAVYYQLNGIMFNADNTIYLILMAIASGLTAMVGYDKIRETIEQLTSK